MSPLLLQEFLHPYDAFGAAGVDPAAPELCCRIGDLTYWSPMAGAKPTLLRFLSSSLEHALRGQGFLLCISC
jgi:hypothetical protein